VGREDFKIYRGVFDDRTLGFLEELLRREYLDGIKELVKIGKEAEVYLGFLRGEARAVKIYRINNSTFKNIVEYLKKDVRYRGLTSKFNRKTILIWVEREFRNLLRAHKVNVNVPFPYVKKENIIVMEFIDGKLLKDVELKNPKDVFNVIKEQIKLLLSAKMVHGDLSEFNIIVKENIPYLIDFGQAIFFQNNYNFSFVEDLLNRDINNIVRFFNKNYDLSLNSENELRDIKKILEDF